MSSCYCAVEELSTAHAQAKTGDDCHAPVDLPASCVGGPAVAKVA